jgi:L-iditol 2-dehydrogenase
VKAVVKRREGVGNVELMEVPKPVPKAGEVVIKVMAAGVCGTDIKILHGDAWSNPPVILGHEFSGIIDSLGPDVKGIAPGDRVVAETAQVICGTCEYCKSGRYLMCDQRLSIGYGVDGAFAEYIAVRQEIVHKIPNKLSFDAAAVCEPFAVALHGVWDTGEILPGDTVVVMGPGAIGQLAAQAAKVKGATVVLIGTESDRQRLAIAGELGVDYPYCEFDRDAIMNLTEGRGADLAVDCTGAQIAIRNALGILKKTGRMIQIGLTKPTLELEYSLLTAREIAIIGSFGHRWANWEQAIKLMATGKVQVEKIVTGHFTLGQWQEAFAAMESQKGIKILIHPNP